MTHVISVLIGFEVAGINHILDPRGIEGLPQGRRTDIKQGTINNPRSAGSLTRDTREPLGASATKQAQQYGFHQVIGVMRGKQHLVSTQGRLENTIAL